MSSGGVFGSFWCFQDILVILVFSRYFGGSGNILIILEVLGLFELFFSFWDYFGHFNMSEYFCHFLGSEVILIILEFSRLFWLF